MHLDLQHGLFCHQHRLLPDDSHDLLPTVGASHRNANGMLHSDGAGSSSLQATLHGLPPSPGHLREASPIHLRPLRATDDHQEGALHDLLVDLRNDHQEGALHDLLVDLRDDYQEGSIHDLLVDLRNDHQESSLHDLLDDSGSADPQGSLHDLSPSL